MQGLDGLSAPERTISYWVSGPDNILPQVEHAWRCNLSLAGYLPAGTVEVPLHRPRCLSAMSEIQGWHQRNNLLLAWPPWALSISRIPWLTPEGFG